MKMQEEVIDSKSSKAKKPNETYTLESDEKSILYLDLF